MVGEDEGTTTQYAYITSSDANSETWTSGDSKASGDGEWLWTRDVVINGEQTTLTEKGDTNPYIRQMARGEWWEVKFNAEGHVRKASKVTFADTSGKFINNIKLVEASVEKFDTVVLWHDLTAKEYGISVKGNTLQIDNASGDKFGFAVRNDAKIVLAQDSEIYRNGVGTGKYDLMDVITEYDNGAKGLEKAVKDLEANDDFKGYVSAVFEGGVATSVVIWDKTHGKVEIGNEGTAEGIVKVDYSDATDVLVEYYGDEPTKDQCVSAIIDKLENDGYTVTDVIENNDGTVTIKTERTVNGKIVKKTFTYNNNTQEKIEIVVNGKDVYVDEGIDTMAAVATAAGVKSADQGKWVKTVLSDVEDWTDVNANSLTIADGDTFEFGYYKLKVTEGVTGSTTNLGSATLKAYLKGEEAGAETFIKKEAIDVVLDLKNTHASENTEDALTITSDNGTVTSVNGKNGSKLEVLKATKGVEVVVSLAAKDISNDIVITLTEADFVETLNITVNYDGKSENLAVLEDVDDWMDILNMTGFKASATTGYVRNDEDWTEGDSVGTITNITLADGGSYTFGCVEMQRGTDSLGSNNTTAAWTVNDAEMTTSTKYYMVKGEKITVALETNATGLTLAGASATLEIDGADNSSVSAEAGTYTYTATAAESGTATAADGTVTLAGAASGKFVSGTSTFTITVGDDGDDTLLAKITNA